MNESLLDTDSDPDRQDTSELRSLSKTHLEQALDEDIPEEKNYHIRQALQVLTVLGCISWGTEGENNSKGAQWDEVKPFLQLLQDHRGELPDDWL